VAEDIYHQLHLKTPAGFYLVADSAFPRGGQELDGRIKVPLKAGQRIEGSPEELRELLQFNRELLSFRQTAEWGNRGLQGSFGRLRVPLPIKFVERRSDIIEVCMCAFCLCTKLIGFNQIKSVYVGEGNREDEQTLSALENIFFADRQQNDRVLRFHITADF
jgi:hypothetical protein